MNINVLTYLPTLLISILLALLVLRRNRKNPKNIVFAFLTLSITVWTITLIITDGSKDKVIALDFGRLALVGPIFIPYLLVLFSYYFPVVRKKWPKKIFFILATPLLFLLAIVPTDLNIKEVKLHDWGAETIPGIGYYVFIIYFVIYSFFALGFLIKKFRASKGAYREQLRYVTLGISVSLVISIFTNAIIPLFGIVNLSVYGPPASLIFLFCIAYAIIKHKLLDIKLIILRTLTYSILVIFVSAFVVSIGIFVPNFSKDISFQIGSSIVISIILVLILDPLKKYVGKATDKIFFKANIDYRKLLQELVEVVNKEIDQENLIREIDHKLINYLRLDSVRIILPEPSGSIYVPLHKDEKQYFLETSSNLVKYLKQQKKIVILDALERRIEDTQDQLERENLEKSKMDIEKMGASVIAPIVTDSRLAAILVLGNKKSGDNFNQDDLNLLELLGPQLASAIEKSRLYEEIRLFNQKLQKEIAVATEDLRKANVDLQDRNRFLTSLQTVMRLITRSLDFKKVTQDIVNSISLQMGYIGGVLLFYGESRHKLFAEAISKVRFVKEIEMIIGKDLSKYYSDVRTSETLAVKTVLTGEIQKSGKLTDFVTPPIPTFVANQIQKLIHANGFTSIPIFSENETVGCIIFVTEQTPDELTENDLNMMNSLADQTGVIYRNLELVRQMKQANAELGDANEHLKQLDQAKSEFVSIASHQLRTPMTGIMGYLSMFVGGDFGKIKPEHKEILQKLLDASHRMIQLINLFLDVTKIESGRLVLDRRPAQIEDIIHRAYDVLNKIAKDKGLKFEIIKNKKLLPALTIDDKIFDVVSNLIDNAIKYTEKGSITVKAEKDGDSVRVSVKDTGRGIPPQEAKNLFNKFVRGYGIAQVNPDGSGLGLYVARRLTEAHGGKIWVESNGKGKGSTFIFTLPISQIPVEDAT